MTDFMLSYELVLQLLSNLGSSVADALEASLAPVVEANFETGSANVNDFGFHRFLPFLHIAVVDLVAFLTAAAVVVVVGY